MPTKCFLQIYSSFDDRIHADILSHYSSKIIWVIIVCTVSSHQTHSQWYAHSSHSLVEGIASQSDHHALALTNDKTKVAMEASQHLRFRDISMNGWVTSHSQCLGPRPCQWMVMLVLVSAIHKRVHGSACLSLPLWSDTPSPPVKKSSHIFGISELKKY